jgi:hypothetical protein
VFWAKIAQNAESPATKKILIMRRKRRGEVSTSRAENMTKTCFLSLFDQGMNLSTNLTTARNRAGIWMVFSNKEGYALE